MRPCFYCTKRRTPGPFLANTPKYCLTFAPGYSGRDFFPLNFTPAPLRAHFPLSSRVSYGELNIGTVNQSAHPPLEWVFAYGSLVWRPGFDFEHSELAQLPGWKREFSQGSPDHRGTPDYPGRVLTLRQDHSGSCAGVAYRIAKNRWASIVEYLDVRESGGYSRQQVTISLASGQAVPALTYIALPDNPHACGPESTDELIALIKSRVGPSGSNLDYVLNLASALNCHGIRDNTVDTLAGYLREVRDAERPQADS